MTRNVCLSLFLAAPLLLSTVGYAQQTSPAAQPSASANISLNVVVTAKNGTPVSGLQEKDFKLLDDKVPAPITSFRAMEGSSAPVEVLLVIDTVNVPYIGVSHVREQVEGFLRANGGQLAFPTAVAIVTDTGTQFQQTFSKDGNAEAERLEHAATSLRIIHRSTGVWGASERAWASVDAMGNLIAHESPHPGRKLIVWVSPGWPFLSGPIVDKGQENRIFRRVVGLSTAMRQGGITLYDVDPIGPGEDLRYTSYYQDFLKGVSHPYQVNLGDLALQVLATESGGLVLTSSNDVVGELQRCMADGTAYYAVSFAGSPNERRHQYHSLKLQMAEPGLTARTWDSYYGYPAGGPSGN